MENLPDRIDSKFRFVLLAASRAEQIVQGARTKVEGKGRKPTRVAIEELGGNLIAWDYGPPPVPEEEEAVEEEEQESELLN
jgi:DNA-directed RNA polymerase omega subunit